MTLAWRFDLAFGTNGAGDGQFESPSAVAVKANGNVLVSDDLRNDYQELTPTGTFVRKSPNSGNGLLQDPFGITVSPVNDDIFAIGNSGTRILQYQSNGTWIRTIGTTGTGNGQFQDLGKLAVGNDGVLYAGDFTRQDIQTFTSAGVFISVWKTNAVGFVAVSHFDGLIWAPINGTTQSFDSAGTLIHDYGAVPPPYDFSSTANYEAYNVDPTAMVFRVFDKTLTQPGAAYGSGPGSGPGQFAASDPYDIAHYGNFVYVADHNNHRIQRWVLDDQIPVSGPHPPFGRGAC